MLELYIVEPNPPPGGSPAKTRGSRPATRRSKKMRLKRDKRGRYLPRGAGSKRKKHRRKGHSASSRKRRRARGSTRKRRKTSRRRRRNAWSDAHYSARTTTQWHGAGGRYARHTPGRDTGRPAKRKAKRRSNPYRKPKHKARRRRRSNPPAVVMSALSVLRTGVTIAAGHGIVAMAPDKVAEWSKKPELAVGWKGAGVAAGATGALSGLGYVAGSMLMSKREGKRIAIELAVGGGIEVGKRLFKLAKDAWGTKKAAPAPTAPAPSLTTATPPPTGQPKGLVAAEDAEEAGDVRLGIIDATDAAEVGEFPHETDF